MENRGRTHSFSHNAAYINLLM